MIVVVIVTCYLLMLYSNSSKIARDYIFDYNYLVIWSYGDIHSYSLDKNNLFEMPYVNIWSLQDKSPVHYLDQEITSERFLGFHPKYGLRHLFVLKANQELIGGHSNDFKLLPSNGLSKSITGEEVTKENFLKWKEKTKLEISKLN